MRKGTLLLVASLLLVFLGVLYAGENRCASFKCGCCCSKDRFPCCDRSFKTEANTVATLAYTSPDEEAAAEVLQDEYTPPLAPEDVEHHIALEAHAEAESPSINLRDQIIKDIANQYLNIDTEAEAKKAIENGGLNVAYLKPLVNKQGYVCFDDNTVATMLGAFGLDGTSLCTLDCWDTYQKFYPFVKAAFGFDLKCQLEGGITKPERPVKHNWVVKDVALGSNVDRCFTTNDLVRLDSDDRDTYAKMILDTCYAVSGVKCNWDEARAQRDKLMK